MVSHLGRDPETHTVKSHDLSGLTFLPTCQQGSQAVTAMATRASVSIPTQHPGILRAEAAFLVMLKTNPQPSPDQFMWLDFIPYDQVPCSGSAWVPLEQTSPSATPWMVAFLS